MKNYILSRIDFAKRDKTFTEIQNEILKILLPHSCHMFDIIIFHITGLLCKFKKKAKKRNLKL